MSPNTELQQMIKQSLQTLLEGNFFPIAKT